MRFDTSEKAYIRILIDEKLSPAQSELEAMREWMLELNKKLAFLEKEIERRKE